MCVCRHAYICTDVPACICTQLCFFLSYLESTFSHFLLILQTFPSFRLWFVSYLPSFVFIASSLPTNTFFKVLNELLSASNLSSKAIDFLVSFLPPHFLLDEG